MGGWSMHGASAMLQELFHVPTKPLPTLQPDVFDDPFEPPPQSARWDPSATPCGSTTLGSGSLTPASTMSGAATPGFGDRPCDLQGVCTLVPVWFPMCDRTNIPSGIVQRAKALFERNHE